jgi:hypothetical protein
MPLPPVGVPPWPELEEEEVVVGLPLLEDEFVVGLTEDVDVEVDVEVVCAEVVVPLHAAFAATDTERPRRSAPAVRGIEPSVARIEAPQDGHLPSCANA